MLSLIQTIVSKEHSGDADQLKVIFSDKKRILVEAPAGCGKTKLMVSRICYLLASNQIPTNKKILALTFSVNAAYKIKKDAYEKIPEFLVQAKSKYYDPKSKLFSTNYHGLARRILRLYGNLVADNLSNIDYFKSIDDSAVNQLSELEVGLTTDDTLLLSTFSENVKTRNIAELRRLKGHYLSIVKRVLIPNKIIPYNAILILANDILQNHPPLLKGYQKIFSHIIVDEFQDTNIISYSLVDKLINDDSNVMFMGDSLQRIYGFIGAIPDLMAKATKKYNLDTYLLKTNYRYRDNPQLLSVDNLLRENAFNFNQHSKAKASIKAQGCPDQESEATFVRELASALASNSDCRVAILVRSRGNNTNAILKELDNNSLDYFYALFKDDDVDYLRFHSEAKKTLTLLSKGGMSFNKTIANKLIKTISSTFACANKKYKDSMLTLLEAFFNNIFEKQNFLGNDEKLSFVYDTFEGNALKQSLGNIPNRITVTTVHAAKGLEWEYVIIPDFEQFTFPSFFGMCKPCRNKLNCDLLLNQDTPLQILESFPDEISLFYVAATRAKKDLFLTFSTKSIDSRGNHASRNCSCFFKLNGLTTVNYIA